MKIYTKQGDKGSTRLATMALVLKNHPSIEAIGAVDELNAWIGKLCVGAYEHQLIMYRKIQGELFEIGAELAQSKTVFEKIDEAVRYMEDRIDENDRQLKPLKNFILPGGTEQAADCHIARAVCRRAERAVVALSNYGETNIKIVTYLNRLSDLLFVLARRHTQIDTIWKAP